MLAQFHRFSQLVVGLVAIHALASAQTIPPPAVDHHQHLLSAAAASVANTPPLDHPLPPGVDKLLKRRALQWNDPVALTKLYTRDAAILTGDLKWVTGAEAVSSYVSATFSRPYHVTPVSFSQRGRSVDVSGYYTLGSGTEARHFGYAYLGLVEVTQGEWKIATEVPTYRAPDMEQPVSAADLIQMLDKAAIRRAIILSDAYYFDGAAAHGDLAAVRRENDWTADEAAKFPGRLFAFCSFNPLSDYALSELARCAASGRFKGIKLHLRASGVDLLNPAQVAKLRKVFAAADRSRMPIILHARANEKYGASEAEQLVRLTEASPHIVITIGHLWGGEGFSAPALSVFVRLAGSHRNLYFDVAEVARLARTPEQLQQVAASIRAIGLDHILYGSDGPEFGNQQPAEAWAAFRDRIPLSPAELTQIAGNVAPYLEKNMP
jgi:predicted TIM-barrel fold metal-dependent hydrolase